MHVLLFVIIGLVAGALAGRVVSGHGYGAVGDICVGVIGALLGGWIFSSLLGVTAGGFVMSLLAAFLGAVVFLWLIRLITPSRA
ncbi:MAG: GlsB/YeaQ/YmgE family stress response membrane protein [Candidatus Rokubacteria bacterium]|nr:GlsB/YeaQ/YmgE family stress response membrane protein [Candidatus Rokubacteria bacterium]